MESTPQSINKQDFMPIQICLKFYFSRNVWKSQHSSHNIATTVKASNVSDKKKFIHFHFTEKLSAFALSHFAHHLRQRERSLISSVIN